MFDLAVVGAGPAGLAAAVYGASEGLADDRAREHRARRAGRHQLEDRELPRLSRPASAAQALAGRAQVQAQKFGARLAVSRAVVALDCDEAPYRLALDDGASIRARAVVIATGARYRKLDVPGFERFEGQGIYYAATAMEANLCRASRGGRRRRRQLGRAGGGVPVAARARHVHVLVRGAGLAATMSDYLVQRIERSAQISLHTHSEIVGLEGESALSRGGLDETGRAAPRRGSRCRRSSP